jgi:predicted MFS family arabinose efflux permease
MLTPSTSNFPEAAMRPKLGILLTVCAAVLAINLDTTIVNVALPSISRELDAGTRALQWVVDGYNLAFAGLVLAMGSVSDRFGRRPALIEGLVGFAVASVAGALVTTPVALVAARGAMGFFAALIFPTTLSIISNTFRERRERAAALGVWGAVVGIGVAAGPVTGGVLLEHFRTTSMPPSSTVECCCRGSSTLCVDSTSRPCKRGGRAPPCCSSPRATRRARTRYAPWCNDSDETWGDTCRAGTSWW